MKYAYKGHRIYIRKKKDYYEARIVGKQTTYLTDNDKEGLTERVRHVVDLMVSGKALYCIHWIHKETGATGYDRETYSLEVGSRRAEGMNKSFPNVIHYLQPLEKPPVPTVSNLKP